MDKQIKDAEICDGNCRSGAIPAWRRKPVFAALAVACAVMQAGGALAAERRVSSDLLNMSLEELTNIEITSVSKRAEQLGTAAAAIYVINRDDIRRSGYNTIPELLRLAPNLQVARTGSDQYAITARGFNSTSANKLLVLIDGRTVYTPLFSGVFWDVQDTMIEDIERIEVISGPGGVQWGSNAVNGVINIITRSSRDTQGGIVAAGAGNRERRGAVRYGGKINEDTSYRVYAKRGLTDHLSREVGGSSAQDASNLTQAGFRLDWGRSDDALTLQGDIYGGSADQAGVNADRTTAGGNVLLRWNRELSSNSGLQVQAYFDRTRRAQPGSFGEVLDTYDLDMQHRFRIGDSHDVVWGGGYRHMADTVENSAAFAFLPANKTLRLANVFAQDTISLGNQLKLTVGAKLEHNSYTGMEFQPNARLGYQLGEGSFLWTSLSRAVRTPSRLDREFFLPGNAPFLFVTGPGFVSEKLTALEIGYRAQPHRDVSYSINTFYNKYDNLRSIEPTGGITSILANKLLGDTYGVETWGNYQVRDWWRLSAGYNHLWTELRFKPDSRDTTTIAGGADPSHQFSLRSRMNLADNVEWDIGLRKVSGLSNPNVPGYTALDTRIGWKVSHELELSLSVQNLADSKHPEFGARQTATSRRSEIPRTVYIKAQWSFK